jgi:hypothetical protein
MRNVTTLVFVFLLFVSSARAQTLPTDPTAEQTVQPSQSATPDLTARIPTSEVRIPAGMPIEVEVAYTVNSLDIKPGERISFRVLVPIVIGGATVIERDALVTARITEAKRGGHWGKAGKIAWSMEDVVAADNSRIPLAPETGSRNDKLWSLETGSTTNKTATRQGRITGTSHVGEVATMAAVSGVLFPPLALIHGFKRGENAILREGRRYVVAVGRDTTVKVVPRVAAP